MPRPGTIAAGVVAVLRKHPDGADLATIRAALAKRHSGSEAILPHSIRSSIYRNLDDKGERLFVRVPDVNRGRPGCYALRDDPGTGS